MQKILKSLFPNKNIGFLFAGQMISQMGDSMFLIGLMWFVLDFTGSKAAMGTVAFISHIPNLVLGIFGGILVDMFNRRRVMMYADLARAVIVLTIPVTFYLGIINLPIIIATSFMLSTFATLFNPARDSIMPSLVGKENLLRANSMIQVSNYIAILIGPAIGAAAIAALGVIHLFSLDALTFILSFISILFIKYTPLTETKFESNKVIIHLKEIIKYVHHNKRVKNLLAVTAINNFFIMGPAIIGIPIFVKEVLGEGASSYALVESCYGVGMILGAVFINYLTKYFGKGKILLLGLIFDGFTYAVLYWINSLPLMMIAISFHAIGIPFIVVARTSLMQEWTDDDKLGRVFSLVNIAVIGMTALTTGFTGSLAEFVDIKIIFFIFGCGGVVTGFIGWLSKDIREG